MLSRGLPLWQIQRERLETLAALQVNSVGEVGGAYALVARQLDLFELQPGAFAASYEYLYLALL